MTKKIFHKLLRAWFTNAHKRHGVRSEDKVLNKYVMQNLKAYKAVNRAESTVPYAEIWQAITSNGAMTLGVGVRRT